MVRKFGYVRASWKARGGEDETEVPAVFEIARTAVQLGETAAV